MIGALLVIATLGIDPFLQGTPAYPIELFNSTGAASVDIATSYYDAVLSDAAADGIEQWWQLGPSTKGAFYSGIFNTTSSTAIVPTCTTGNCTWHEYSSLAVCSACADISSSLASEYNPEGYDGPSYIWTLPNGMEADSADVQMITGSSGSVKYGHLQHFALADVSSIYWASPMGYGKPSAEECILYFCVKTYQATVSRGTFREHLVRSLPNASTPAPLPTQSTHMLPEMQRTDVSLLVGESGEYNNIDLTPPGVAGNYSVSNVTLVLTRGWVQATLTGFVSSSEGVANVSDVSQVLYNAQKANRLPAFMDNIANSLTAQIRGVTGEKANGTTQSGVTVVHIRWSWLTFPVVVLALALVFVATTMVLSAREHMPTWKSNTLPGVVYSMDENTCAAIAARGPRLRDMEKESRRHLVAMSRDEGRWMLMGSAQEYGGASRP